MTDREGGSAVVPARSGLVTEVIAELRWAFRPPWHWLSGVAANFVLSLLYLWVVPLTGHHRGNWVVLLGSYFGTFILADITTTNIFGPDAVRVGQRLADGVPFRRLLLVKN
ncbi:MAG TPA: hypothetical protein VK816_04700, partial [Jatrophihabitantaceae bacterium]|nr:hypothetical protein [Jatrophihabitantaceae bacterium]